LNKRHPAYEAYVKRTSVFVPMPPKQEPVTEEAQALEGYRPFPGTTTNTSGPQTDENQSPN